MNWPPLRSALRQMHAVYADRRALAAMGLVGAVLGVVGPFGTFEMLDLGVRLLYWVLIAFATYGAGLFGGTLLSAWAVPAKTPRAAHVLLMALGAAGPVTLTVLAINALILPEPVFRGFEALALLGYCLAISLGLVTLIETVVAPGKKPAGAPAILRRLPPHLRGRLSHLSMADHYVEIHTDKGQAMVLMRLADAIGETEGVPGLQIHRSHWVARDAVRALSRKDGRWGVELAGGVRLPVSRGFLARAREAFGP